MRTPSIRLSGPCTALSLVLLCVAPPAIAQDGRDDTPTARSSATTTSRTSASDTNPAGGRRSARSIDPDTGEALFAPIVAPEVGLAASLAAQQDYSVQGMFGRNHGKFMQDRRRFRPDLRVSLGYQAKTTGSGTQPGSFDFMEIRGDLDVETAVDPDNYVHVGGSGSYRSYKFTSESLTPDQQLGYINARIGGGTFLQEETLLHGYFMPGIYSDFGGTLTSSDYRWKGMIAATHRFDEKFFGDLGIEVSDVFADVPVYPIIGAHWLFIEGWRLDVVAPRYVEVSWYPDPSWVLSGGLSVDGNRYHVRGSISRGSPHYNIQVQEIRLYFEGIYRFNDLASAFVKTGSTLSGDNDFSNDVGIGFNNSTNPAFFIEIGGGLNF